MLALVWNASFGVPSAWGTPTWHEFDRPIRQGRCIDLHVLRYQYATTPIEGHDWIALGVQNACPKPLTTLRVRLALLDAKGRSRQFKLWLLGRGDVVFPRTFYRERFPLTRVPEGWQWVAWRASIEQVGDGDRRVP